MARRFTYVEGPIVIEHGVVDSNPGDDDREQYFFASTNGLLLVSTRKLQRGTEEEDRKRCEKLADQANGNGFYL
jgi:hypothetical protein